ncbi:hypothetical protein K0M31_016035 [Melipona bicolor]|uniref:Uncharacterized protein n=1 Tax=Melipona bicolor TaxID=60889 RepID=A0AA40G675_9HYME|nr:hypothetical protein K0M31_016035 [Melipona bicolor]
MKRGGCKNGARFHRCRGKATTKGWVAPEGKGSAPSGVVPDWWQPFRKNGNAKLKVQVPQRFTERNYTDCATTRVPLLACNTKLLERLITGDEKWILYNNPQRKQTWTRREEQDQRESEIQLLGTFVYFTCTRNSSNITAPTEIAGLVDKHGISISSSIEVTDSNSFTQVDYEWRERASKR